MFIIKARSQTAWAMGLCFFLLFRPNNCGLGDSGVVSGLSGECCNVVNYVEFFYLDRQR